MFMLYVLVLAFSNSIEETGIITLDVTDVNVGCDAMTILNQVT